jgi:hypothetical protein
MEMRSAFVSEREPFCLFDNRKVKSLVEGYGLRGKIRVFIGNTPTSKIICFKADKTTRYRDREVKYDHILCV